MAKKHNKSRKQKPNYSKRGMNNVNLEAGTELELGQGITDKSCSRNEISCERPKKR